MTDRIVNIDSSPIVDVLLAAGDNIRNGVSDDRRGNIIASAFGQILRYRKVLDEIVSRYVISGAEAQRTLDRMKAAVSGRPSGPVSEELAAALAEQSRAFDVLHLDIESFYLFAKILLDKVAHTLEARIGPTQEVSLDSHDRLTKGFSKLCEVRGLRPEPALTAALEDLKYRVADYRDYEIAHEKSPRTIKATTFSAAGDFAIAPTRSYPRDSDTQRSSESIEVIRDAIDQYLRLMVSFMLKYPTDKGL